MEERVDILAPPLFEKTGEVKTREEAAAAGNWINTFNLWIVQKTPVPSLIYQIRSPEKSWAPGKLDVTVGGHYLAGETMHDGVREVEEELGKSYTEDQLLHLGRKMYIGNDAKGREMHDIIEIYITADDSPIDSFTLQKEEVYAICACPIDELIRVHTESGYSFTVSGLTAGGEAKEITVKKDSFPENYDNYHFKMVLLAKRYLAGEKYLLY